MAVSLRGPNASVAHKTSSSFSKGAPGNDSESEHEQENKNEDEQKVTVGEKSDQSCSSKQSPKNGGKKNPKKKTNKKVEDDEDEEIWHRFAILLDRCVCLVYIIAQLLLASFFLIPIWYANPNNICIRTGDTIIRCEST